MSDYIQAAFEKGANLVTDLQAQKASAFFYVQKENQIGLSGDFSVESIQKFLQILVEEKPEEIKDLAEMLGKVQEQIFRTLVGSHGYPHFEEDLIGVLTQPDVLREGGLTDVLWYNIEHSQVKETGAGYVQEGELFILGIDTPMTGFAMEGKLIPGQNYWNAVTGKPREATKEGTLAPSEDQEEVTLHSVYPNKTPTRSKKAKDVNA